MNALYDTGPFAPCPAPFNMAEHVLRAGLDCPDKIALAVLKLSGAERWSHGRLRAAVLGTATGLLESGLTPGDRLLLRLGNTVDFPIAYLAALAVGIVPVPTSSQLTLPEITRIARDITPAAALRCDAIACPEDLRQIPLPALRAMRDLPAADFQRADPDRLGYIVFTSGTSGTPRAVMHAHRAIWARQMMMRDWYDLAPSDRLLHAGGFNWTFTLGTGLMDPWTMGATALIPAPGLTPAQLPLLMARNDATLFAAAPGVFRQMLRAALPAMPKLRHALSAGEKLPEPLRAAWRDATGTQIYEAFGMSECSTFISASPTRPAAPGCLGAPQRGRRVAILTADGQPAPRGTPGTIAVDRRDPGLMLGYLNAPEATKERFSDDWFLTGDSAEMLEDGQIRYLGRSDDMMNAGGFRVSPLEVEAALAACPGITEIAVTEVEIKPDTRVIAAFYTGPEPLDEAALTAFAAAHLARYKQPRIYQHMDSLPRNPNGKLARNRLRLSALPG